MHRDYITVPVLFSPVLCSDVQHVGFAVISFFTTIREVQILGKTVVRSCETGTHIKFGSCKQLHVGTKVFSSVCDI